MSEVPSVEYWLTDELNYSRGPYDPWGRKVIRALDVDDYIQLKRVFETHQVLGANINEQTTMYGYAGHVWSAWMHNFLGDTVLHIALKQKKMACIYGILLLAGVDVTIRNEAGDTADDLCFRLFGESTAEIKIFARKNVYRLVDPRRADSIPDLFNHRNIEQEAWELMEQGRLLHIDVPKSFNFGPLYKRKNLENWAFKLNRYTKTPYMLNVNDGSHRNMNPHEKVEYELQWHQSTDSNGNRCYINKVDNESVHSINFQQYIRYICI